MGTFFELGKDKGMGSVFRQLCPRHSGTLTSTAPSAIGLWETSDFLHIIIFTVSVTCVCQMCNNIATSSYILSLSLCL